MKEVCVCGLAENRISMQHGSIEVHLTSEITILK